MDIQGADPHRAAPGDCTLARRRWRLTVVSRGEDLLRTPPRELPFSPPHDQGRERGHAFRMQLRERSVRERGRARDDRQELWIAGQGKSGGVPPVACVVARIRADGSFL